MMRYFVLVLLISTLIIGDVAGETRHEALNRMLHSDDSLKHSAVKRQSHKGICYSRPRPPVPRCYQPRPKPG